MNGEAVVDESALIDGTETCACCGRVISRLEQPFVSADQIVCFGCYRHAQERERAESPPVGEHVFLADSRIRITQSNITTEELCYSLADVRFARVRKLPARRLLAVLVAVIGFAILAVGLNRNLDQWDRILLAIGFPLLGVGLLLSVLIRTRYVVLLTVHDIEQAAVCSRSRKYAKRVADVIAQALVERGQNPSIIAQHPSQGRRRTTRTKEEPIPR